MKRIIVALILAGLMAIATAVPAFADIPPAEAEPGGQNDGAGVGCVSDNHDPATVAAGAAGNSCGP